MTTSKVLHHFRPTIVAALLLIGAATMLWWAGFNDESPAVVPGGASQPRTADGPAADYVAFAGRLANGSATLDVVVEALRKLAGAVGTLEPTAPEVPVDLRVAAEHIRLSPDSAGTTEAVRESLLAAADSLEGGSAASPTLRSLAESIDRRIPLAQQQDELARFLVRAAEILHAGPSLSPHRDRPAAEAQPDAMPRR